MGCGTGQRSVVTRSLLVLAAVLLLPLAAMLQQPRPVAAQSAGQDSLWIGSWWAGHLSSYGTCANPSSPGALASCFSSPTSSPVMIGPMATDGVNVYYAGNLGGLSCPIADLGANCTQIMAGPWPIYDSLEVLAIAAYGGQIWIGQQDGLVYRCPSNLPYFKQDDPPSQCVQLADAGDHPISSLLLANGSLYVGVACAGKCDESKNGGWLWACDPLTANSCFTLDSYGDTLANSLAAGGGYLWAGLENGIIWRCDLNTANACSNWEQAANGVASISYDGQGTLYAAVLGKGSSNEYGAIWSCPTAYANGCDNVLSNVNGTSVAAGAGSVFSFTGDDGNVPGNISFGTSEFASVNSTFNQHSSYLLYVPAEGTAGVGGVQVNVRDAHPGRKLVKRCNERGKQPRATIELEGPNGFTKTTKVGACDLAKGGTVTATVDLLDPGRYSIRVQAGKHGGLAGSTVVAESTRPVNVKLKRGARR
jgi:hypothetical protein